MLLLLLLLLLLDDNILLCSEMFKFKNIFALNFYCYMNILLTIFIEFNFVYTITIKYEIHTPKMPNGLIIKCILKLLANEAWEHVHPII